jgi:hypothetical protein
MVHRCVTVAVLCMGGLVLAGCSASQTSANHTSAPHQPSVVRPELCSASALDAAGSPGSKFTTRTLASIPTPLADIVVARNDLSCTAIESNPPLTGDLAIFRGQRAAVATTVSTVLLKAGWTKTTDSTLLIEWQDDPNKPTKDIYVTYVKGVGSAVILYAN